MRLPIVALLVTLAVTPAFNQIPTAQPAQKGQRLEDLTWPEAERLLTPETIVVVPLGAASNEHGPHLKLRNDLTLAEHLTRRILAATDVVVAPTLTYHHYPAFLEYPGSTSLTLNTARDMTAEVVRTLAAYGPRRFYVLNTAMSTVRALDPAVRALAAEGVLLRYTNLGVRLDAASRGLREQADGSHADEIETSMMLYIDPNSVDMTKAVKDLGPDSTPLLLTRQRGGQGTYSPTGTWGDPTLATAAKGKVFVELLVAGILEDIMQLRYTRLPVRSTARPEAPPVRSDSPAPPTTRPPETCSAGDERAIRSIGDAYTSAWANGYAPGIGGLWSASGNIIHPDGAVEQGAEIITQNRARLFARREYRFSRHPLVISMIRCLSADIAVADGKWELRGVFDQEGKPVPLMEGQSTLVVKRSGGWSIEAYRYTIKQQPGPTPTLLQKRPGFPEVIIK